jgi:hypothetical protein
MVHGFSAVTLDGPVPPVLYGILSQMSEQQRALTIARIDDGTPAELLADALGTLGYSISASSIRTFRRRRQALREAGLV